MDFERIGVIMPVFNTEKYLNESIESILNQTYSNFLIVCVDDGSSDNSIKIIEDLAKKNKNIILIRNAHQGVSHARNTGIDYCLGDKSIGSITFVDSDDTIEKDYLEVLVKAKNKYHLKAATCYLRSTKKTRQIGTYKEFYLDYDNLVLNYFNDKGFFESPCLKLIDKEIYRDIRFNEGKRYEDTFICYRLVEKIREAVFVDYNGYNNRLRSDSSSRSAYGNHSYDKLEACKEIYEYYQNSKFAKFAYNKYVGAILVFILKTNKNRKTVTKNEIAIHDFKDILKDKNRKLLNYKFYPFVLAYEIGILRFLSYDFFQMIIHNINKKNQNDKKVIDC